MSSIYSLLDEHVDSANNTVDKEGNIRADFLFSYWVLAWFVLYYILDKTTKYGYYIFKYLSPIIGLWISFIYGIIELCYIIYANHDPLLISKYILMMLLVKLLPIYLIRNQDVNYMRDTTAVAVVFIVYNIYIIYNGTNVIDIYRKTESAISSGESKTPLFRLLDYIYVSFSSKFAN
jgi:hypothetical protein